MFLLAMKSIITAAPLIKLSANMFAQSMVRTSLT